MTIRNIVIAGFLTFFTLLFSNLAYAESNNNIIIKSGTIINGVLITPISSKVNKVGDSVLFKTEKNLMANNVIIIPKGTVGRAVVSKAERAGYFSQAGTIAFRPKYVYAINGVEIPLSFEQIKRPSNEDDLNTAVEILGVGVFAGFFHGRNQKMPIGKKFSMWVSKDTDLEMTVSEIAEKYGSLTNKS